MVGFGVRIYCAIALCRKSTL